MEFNKAYYLITGYNLEMLSNKIDFQFVTTDINNIKIFTEYTFKCMSVSFYIKYGMYLQGYAIINGNTLKGSFDLLQTASIKIGNLPEFKYIPFEKNINLSKDSYFPDGCFKADITTQQADWLAHFLNEVETNFDNQVKNVKCFIDWTKIQIPILEGPLLDEDEEYHNPDIALYPIKLGANNTEYFGETEESAIVIMQEKLKLF